MTLIDDDQVEEVRGELLVDVGLLFGSGHRLVEAQVDLEGLVGVAVRDLRHRRTERLEVVGLGLVCQDVTVDQEEDALLRSGLPQAPDDLKGRVGLARAGGHHEQQSVLASGDSVDGAVDGDRLVVAWRLAGVVLEVVPGRHGFLFGGVALGSAVTSPELFRARELI